MKPRTAIAAAALLAGCAATEAERAPADRPTPAAERPQQDPERARHGLQPVRRWGADADTPDVFKGSGDDWRSSAAYARYRGLVAHEPPLTVGATLEIVARLRAGLSATATFADDPADPVDDNGPAIARRLLAFLDVLGRALATHDADLALWSAVQTDAALGVAQFGALGDDPEFLEAHPVQLFAWFDEDDDRVGYAYATVAQATEFRAVLDLLSRLFAGELPLERVARNLAANDRAWQNYLARGYSQYPWETLVNNLLVTSYWDQPPGHQWVFLHPEPALLADVRSSRTASLEAGLMVHGLGFIDYSDGNEWFWGVSATAVLGSDEELGLGLGATFHLGTTAVDSAFPHLSVGVVWQDYADGDDAVSITLGVDVLRLLQSPDVERIVGRLPR